MTFEQKIRELLSEYGLWPEQHIDAVVKRAKESPMNDGMEGRWGDDMEGYPPTILSILWLAVKTITVEYIDEVMPQAWFRPMFAGEAES